MHYTDHIAQDDVEQLLAETTGPCVSIYLPTTPITPHTDQDQIRLKNLRAEAFERLLARGIRRPDAEAILLPVDEALEDPGFWPYLSDGLAIFCAPAMHALFRVPLSPRPTLEVGERFLLKPLLPLLTEDGIFYVLALSENEARLFEGTRHHVAQIQLEDLPASMAAALAMRGRDPDQPPRRRWHVGDEGQKILYRKYFLQIDRALRPLYGGFSDPLVLAGVDHLLPIFREASSYPHLVATGISGNPERLSAKELHAEAWPIMEPILAGPRRAALARYGALRGTGRTSNDVETILSAALEGRVESLFLNLAISAYGAFDETTRSAVVRETPEPGDVDLSAWAARWAYRTGADIFAGEPPEVPHDSPIAAVFRYA
jgi:hypothetical protein